MTATNAPKPKPKAKAPEERDARTAELEEEIYGEVMTVEPDLAEAGARASRDIIVLRPSAKTEAERVPAFRINGKTHSILTRPRTNQALRYINLARTRGNEIAIDFMLETLLGDGYAALMDFDGLTEAHLEQVITAASEIMAGALDNPKGKQPRGSRRSAG